MANKYENAENIGKLLSGGALSELNKKVGASERRMSEILKKLSDMESASGRQKTGRGTQSGRGGRGGKGKTARARTCRRGGQARTCSPRKGGSFRKGSRGRDARARKGGKATRTRARSRKRGKARGKSCARKATRRPRKGGRQPRQAAPYRPAPATGYVLRQTQAERQPHLRQQGHPSPPSRSGRAPRRSPPRRRTGQALGSPPRGGRCKARSPLGGKTCKELRAG